MGQHEQSPILKTMLVILSWLITLLFTLQLHAQGPSNTTLPELTAPPIIVTASREPKPFEDSPGTTYVISRHDIERMRYSDVLEALRDLPGVHASQAGPRGSRSSIYMRGLDPNHTLVMIDGIRVNDPMNNRGGSFDLSTLSLDNVERIEVVEGPLSAVYGSDAIAGAINIITQRQHPKSEFRLDLSGGRFGYHRAAAGASGPGGPAEYSLTGSFVDEGNIPNDGVFRGWNVNGGIKLKLPADASIRGILRLSDVRGHSFPAHSGGPNLAVIRALEKRRTNELTTGFELNQRLRSWLDYSISTNYYRRREHDDFPGIAAGLRDPFGIPEQSSRDSFQRFGFALRATATIGNHLSASFGGDFYDERGSSRSAILINGFPIPAGFGLERMTGGPFIEGFWKCPCGLIMQAGLRTDLSNTNDSNTTPRLTASYQFPKTRAVLSASWGRGFKLPSFFSLANPIVGNPRLTSETSEGFDFGLRYNVWDRLMALSVKYFSITVKDLIDFEPGPPPALINRSEVVSTGIEVGVTLNPLDDLRFTGHLTYNDTDIRSSPDKLLNRPHWRGGLGMAWTPVENVLFSIRGLLVGSTSDSSIPTGRVTLDPYQRFDLAFSWRIRPFATLYLALDNVFNSRYKEAVGFPALGIRPRMGIEMKM